MKWPRKFSTKRLHVKLKALKLQGLCRRIEDDDDGGVNKQMVFVEIVWKGRKSGLLPFYNKSSSSSRKRNRSSERVAGNVNLIEWDDEFENLCDFQVVSGGRASGSWNVSFSILHGKNGEIKGEFAILGKVSFDLAELVSEIECSEIERKLPITLNIDGAVVEATLSILVCLAEAGVLPNTAGGVQNSDESNQEDGLFKMIKGLMRQKKKTKDQRSCQKDQLSSCDSDESFAFDSDVSRGNDSATTSSSGELSLGPELESSQSLESTQNYVVSLFSWRKRRLSFRSFKKKAAPLINKTCESSESGVDQHPQSCSVVDHHQQDRNPWEIKELVSRDGETRLKSNVFFASFDQRSEKAAGESACSVLVAVFAHWLHSNQHFMPIKLEFDSLITQGSSEWRKLCDSGDYNNSFPDKHLDLETVLEADLRPIKVLQDKSFTGFFSPDKFECLKDAMSFDQIWDEISHDAVRNNYNPRVYIVSWNDHFFVLKVDSDSYYIIDSLGERLFEGCSQAYMLKFDESSLIYGKVKQEADSEKRGDVEEIICRGKECCREYIKRFLAAIPVRQLEDEEKKGTASASLHQRLQIDFHYTSPCSSSSCSSYSSSATDSIL